MINVVLPRAIRVEAGQVAPDAFADAAMWADTMLAHAEENTRRALDVEIAFTAGGGI